MTIDIRPMQSDQTDALIDLDAIVFGYSPTDTTRSALHEFLVGLRMWVAVDGGRVVGGAGILDLELTVPGGAQVPMAGVTWVGVLPTHRRQGILRGLMAAMTADHRERGQPVAGLSASESSIYRRFGYGPAERIARVEIESGHARYRRPLADSGTLEMMPTAKALTEMLGLHRRLCRQRNGMISRAPGIIAWRYRDANEERDGASPMHCVGHRDAAGDIDGLLTYRIKPEQDANYLPRGEVRINELWAMSATVEAALWQYCFDHDLSDRVFAQVRPADSVIPDLLADPRRWRTTLTDGLYLRPIDVGPLLAARCYGREGSLVLEVHDMAEPRRFRLEGGQDGATCVAATTEPDVVLDAATLGSAYLGDAPLERLHRAGLVEERAPGAVQRASAMFSWSPLPWAGYIF